MKNKENFNSLFCISSSRAGRMVALLIILLFMLVCAVYGGKIALANGRNEQRAGVLLGVGGALRDAFMYSRDQDNPYYRQISSATLLPSEEASKSLLLNLFFRAATSLPVQSDATELGYLVLYNPVSDVALLTSWKFEGETALLQEFRFFPGEYLQAEKVAGPMPRWRESESAPNALRNLGTRYLELTSGGSATFQSRVQASFLNDISNDDVEYATLFRLLGAVGVLTEEFSCRDKFLAAGNSVENLRKVAKFTNIPDTPYNGKQVKLVYGFIVGGYQVGIYVIANSPYVFIFSVSEENSCSVGRTEIINAFE